MIKQIKIKMSVWFNIKDNVYGLLSYKILRKSFLYSKQSIVFICYMHPNMYQYYNFCEIRNMKLFNVLHPLFNIQKHTSFSFQSLTQNETHFPDYCFILSSLSFISVHRIKCQQCVVCEMRRWMWMEKCWFFKKRENVQRILTMNM